MVAPSGPRIAARSPGTALRADYSGRLVPGSLLIVTHFYPPSGMVAARRPAGLAKYLRRLGYDVTVLTSCAWVDEPPGEDRPAGVVRSGDLMASRLNWRRENMRAWTSGQSDYESGSSRLAQVIVPDTALITWLPYLVPRGLRLARRRRFDCVITTSGPESAHLAGLALGREHARGSPTCATAGASRPCTTGQRELQERLDRGLERLVARRADLMTAVSEPLAADLRDRLGADAHTVTNGFDPDEVPAADGREPAARPDPALTGSHGRMASSQRSPAPLLDAVRLLRDRGGAERLELVFAGPLTSDERRLLEAPDLAGVVRHVGNLERAEALQLQREADGLLLLTAGTRRGEATGKLFEYLGAERPVLVLGDDSEAARIVRDAGAGLAAPSADPEAIAAALERLAGDRAGRGAARLLLPRARPPLRRAGRAGARAGAEQDPVERLLHDAGQRAPGPPGPVDEPAARAQLAVGRELRGARVERGGAWRGWCGSGAGSRPGRRTGARSRGGGSRARPRARAARASLARARPGRSPSPRSPAGRCRSRRRPRTGPAASGWSP